VLRLLSVVFARIAHSYAQRKRIMPGSQNSNHPDGKTFAATPPAVPSTKFGTYEFDVKENPGGAPGSKQVPAPLFSPENG
jgi:hypothetical protein